MVLGSSWGPEAVLGGSTPPFQVFKLLQFLEQTELMFIAPAQGSRVRAVFGPRSN